MAAAPDGAVRPGPEADPYRVMVVEDSLVIRGLIARILEADPRIAVVTTVANGKLAVDALERHDVEVVVLDIEMPVMDGLTALPLLMKADPHLQVIMASTLTRRNAEISLRAMAAGAADYIAKPTSSREVTGADEFKRELVAKVLAYGQRRRRSHPRPRSAERPETVGRTVAPPQRQAIVLRPPASSPVAAIGIGSSTGGPQALAKLVAGLDALRQPIFVTQHMPATFTAIFAEHLARATGVGCSEAVDGEPVRPGHVYIAPGGLHMTVGVRGGRMVIVLDDGPRENFCKPSVDPLFRSLAEVYRDRVLGVMLTGMGYDGAAGAKALVDAGSTIVAQDEASSVVWGMPGAVARAGLCSAVLPLGEMARYIREMAGAGR